MQETEACGKRLWIARSLHFSGSFLILFLLMSLMPKAASVSADALDQLSPRDKIFDLAVRGDRIFAVGFPGILLCSSDRGNHFTSIEVPTNDALFSIDIAADGFGAAVGRGGLVVTTRDGGKSWKKSRTETKEHLFSVSVITGGKVWAVGHFGTIIHSADRGRSWISQTYDSTLPRRINQIEELGRARDSVTAEQENEGAVDEARLNSVTFSDENKGWIAGEFGLVLHTDDGGTTWKRQRSNVNLLMFAIRAIDNRKLLAVGSEGILIETEDGGVNWKRVQTGVTEHLLDILQVGEKRYIAGQDGLILIQESRQKAFRRIPVGLYSWLGTAAFFDERSGFIAGGRGYLLKTSDGGTNWETPRGIKVSKNSRTSR
ncbi:MAG: hypothetical protein JXA30_05025 [Deltaproteobacteria bacterium]|nr:hypothetical protein [Deltaproteobacteria bacterium]